jgi:hypothetical protein
VIIEKAEVFEDDAIDVVEVDFVKRANASEASHDLLGTAIGAAQQNGWNIYPVKGYQILPQTSEQVALCLKVTSQGNYTIRAVQFTYFYLGWSHAFNYTWEHGVWYNAT